MKESETTTVNKNSSKKLLISLGLFALLSTVFTLVVKNIGVRPIGPENSSVGLGFLNETVRNFFSYNEFGINDMWCKITKISGYMLFLPVALFFLITFVQLFKRKSLGKIDRELKILVVFYLAVAAVYVVFEKFFIVNFRPVLMDGVLEPSFPSSHTLFAVTLCGSAMMLTKKYLELKHARLVNVLLFLLILVTVGGRMLSGVHWFTDIMGGIFFGATLLAALAYALSRKPAKTKEE